MNKLGKRKAVAYGLVLAGAVVGLLIDRLSRSQAEPAAAVAAASNLLVRTPMPASAGRKTIAGPPIASVFDAASRHGAEKSGTRSPASRRNAFNMTAIMRASFEEAPPEPKAADAERLSQERERLQQQIAEFRSVHKLMGVTIRGDVSWALVDDRLVRLGETVDGFELSSVEHYRASFVKGETRIVLELPEY